MPPITEDLPPAASVSIRHKRLIDIMLAALLLAAVFAVYYPARDGRNLLDDELHITAPALRSAAGLHRIWFQIGATQQYYPVAHTAFWLEYRLWGNAPIGYHLANLLEHAAAALLVVALVRRLRLPGAWLAAFVFALHPLCAESVAWIAEQKNTLSAVFALGATIAYLRFDGERSRVAYGAAMGLFVLALLSKTSVLPLPGVLLVAGWWRRSRLDWRRDALPLLPWFALAAAAGLATLAVERQLLVGAGALAPLAWAGRGALAGRIFWFYLAKLLWPADLSFFYGRWTVDPTAWSGYLPSAAVVLLGGGLCFLARRRRGPLAAFLCFTGLLLPVLGFANMEWFVFSYVADHLQYLASLGAIIPFTAVATDGAARLVSARWLGQGFAGLLVATLGLMTWRQSRLYADPLALYGAAATVSPASAAAHDKLGAVLAGRPGRLREAIAQFDWALRLQPDLPGAYYNRGSAHLQADHLPEAIADLGQALQLQPDSPDILTNLGDALARSGQLPEAIARYDAALRLEPDAADTRADLARAHDQLGFALARERRYVAATDQLTEAVRLDPSRVASRVNLGHLLLLQGRAAAAIAQYEAALRLHPGDRQIQAYLDAALKVQTERTELAP